MITKGMKNGVRRYLLIVSMFMFLVSAGYWILKFLSLVQFISLNLIRGLPPSTNAAPTTQAQLIFGSFILINSIPHMDATTTDPRIKALTRAIDICQVANLVFSLLLNITSTTLIALKAWRFRRWIKFDLSNLRSRRTRGEKIMALLVESGSLYCLSGVHYRTSINLIPLPIGTLGDLYTPVNTQIAGMYPIVVLLVNHGKTLENTVFVRNVSDVTAAPREGPAPHSAGASPQESDIRFRSVRSQSAVPNSLSQNVISTQMSEAMRSAGQHSPTGDTHESPDEIGFGPVKSDIKYTLKYMDAIRE
ncbi:hypothetical protein V5O48_011804 [Marasmius crinis-equi]|uniref:Uncharacterized protein n=1 Tax=Marasmius crinis-equi TaxID=585013 RepID=A0ABR3F4U7_9AGAR